MTSEKILPAVFPNLGLEISYRKKLLRLIDAMNKSFVYWLKAAYKANPPEMAQDISPAESLRSALKQLIRQWERNFDNASKDLAEWFAKSVNRRSTKDLENILRKGGWSVKFQLTKAQRDILAATVQQNVALIKSIPREYHKNVEVLVMQSVQQGRKLDSLAKEIQNQFKVTRKRADLIARDQNQKASAALQRSRQLELGIKEAIWLHSGGGKHPRPTHVANSGKRYDIVKGWYDPAVGKRIFPGTEINCRCASKSVVPGFS